jgi:hypothetical protein
MKFRFCVRVDWIANRLCLHYEVHPINAAKGNKRWLIWASFETRNGQMQMVYVVTTVLSRCNVVTGFEYHVISIIINTLFLECVFGFFLRLYFRASIFMITHYDTLLT